MLCLKNRVHSVVPLVGMVLYSMVEQGLQGRRSRDGSNVAYIGLLIISDGKIGPRLMFINL